MDKKRSKGVTAFAWFELILGVIGILNFSILIILYVAGKYPMERVAYGISNNIEELIFGTLLIIAGILTLKLRPKGRTLSILVFPIIAIFDIWINIVYRCKDFSLADLGGIVIGLFIASLPFYFFTRPKIKEQFKQP